MEALQTRLERSAPVAVNASKRHVSAPTRKRLVLVERHTAEEAAGDSESQRRIASSAVCAGGLRIGHVRPREATSGRQASVHQPAEAGGSGGWVQSPSLMTAAASTAAESCAAKLEVGPFVMSQGALVANDPQQLFEMSHLPQVSPHHGCIIRTGCRTGDMVACRFFPVAT